VYSVYVFCFVYSDNQILNVTLLEASVFEND